MKTTMKKVLSMALALVLLVGVLPMAAQAEVLAHTHKDENNSGNCDDCDYVMNKCNNGHTFTAGAYMSDANQHWQVCTECKNWFEYASHSGGEATCVAMAKCSVCNTEYGSVNTANHVHTDVINASTETCSTNGYTGDTRCLDCTAGVIATGTTIPATGKHVAADNTYGKDANQHWQVCGTGTAAHNFGYAAHTMADADCDSPSTCTVCGYYTGTKVDHDWVEATCTAPRICDDCGITEGTALDHDWAAATCTAPRTCKRASCGKTEGAALGHDWRGGASTCNICGVAANTVTRYTISVNWNYNNHSSTPIATVDAGTSMADAMKNIQQPVRADFTFTGWFYNPGCTSAVTAGDVITGNCTIYAGWKQNVPHEVYVKFYSNGNTSSVYKYVDLYEYAQDGWITKADLQAVANKYIKPNNYSGLSVYGPFDANDWDRYCLDDYYRNNEKIEVNKNDKTVIYAMVHNVQIYSSSSSSSKADSTNPKTGDMIYMPMAVLGLSASALAVMFYLNKKRAY